MQHVQDSNLLPISMEHLTDIPDLITCCAVSKAWKLGLSQARPKTLSICRAPASKQDERRSSFSTEDCVQPKLTQLLTWLRCEEAGVLRQVQHLRVSEGALMYALASDPSEIGIHEMFEASDAVAAVLETAKAWEFISCHVQVCFQSRWFLASLPGSLQRLSAEVPLGDFDLIKIQHLPNLLVLMVKFHQFPKVIRPEAHNGYCMLSQMFECNLHTLHLQHGILDLGSPAKMVAFVAGMRRLRWLSAIVHAVQSQVQALLDLPNLETVSLQLLEPKHRSELDVVQGPSEMTLTI